MDFLKVAAAILFRRVHRFRFHLDVTERCNLSCRHCYREKKAPAEEPAVQDLERILSQCKAFRRKKGEKGSHILTLGGGEPLMRDDLELIIGRAGESGFSLRIVTNGTLIDRDRARSLKRAGLQFVQVSIDGSSRETHEKVRGAGTWERTLTGINALKQSGIFVVLNYILIPELNTDEAPEVFHLAKSVGATGVKFARLLLEGQACQSFQRSSHHYLDTFRRIVQSADTCKYRGFLFLFDPLASKLEEEKQKGSLQFVGTDMCACERTSHMEINGATGDIFFCRSRTVLGNIERDDLESLWENHPLLQSVRSRTVRDLCIQPSSTAFTEGNC